MTNPQFKVTVKYRKNSGHKNWSVSFYFLSDAAQWLDNCLELSPAIKYVKLRKL